MRTGTADHNWNRENSFDAFIIWDHTTVGADEAAAWAGVLGTAIGTTIERGGGIARCRAGADIYDRGGAPFASVPRILLEATR